MGIIAKERSVGAWAFLIGVILAVLIGIATSTFMPIPTIAKYSSWIYGILVILGVVVGYVNVGGKESQTFLLAGTVLVIVSQFGMESINRSLIGLGAGDIITSTFGALLALFIPATIIVALKTVFSIAKV